MAAVREAGGRVVDDLRAIRVVWRRADPVAAEPNTNRASLAQPVLSSWCWARLSPVVPASAGITFRTFLDPMRRAVFAAVDVPSAAVARFSPGLTWGGWRLRTLLELGIVAVLGAMVLVGAMAQFARAE